MRKFAAILAATLLAFVVACTTQPAALPSQFQAHRTTMTLEFANAVCSGTAIGPHAILTATHCLGDAGGPLVKAAGRVAKMVRHVDDGNDHSIVYVDIAFTYFAKVKQGAPDQGAHIFIYGNPAGMPDMYREGYVSGVYDGDGKHWTLYDLNGYFGDSGSGLFDADGTVVAVNSIMVYITDMGGALKLMGSLPLIFATGDLAAASQV